MAKRNQNQANKAETRVVSINPSDSQNFPTIFHQVEDYLKEFYKIRYNVVKCEIEISSIDEDNFKPINDNSLYIELRKKRVNIRQTDLKAILKSDITPRVNLLEEYFKNLNPYDPESEPDYIGQFSNYVEAEDQVEFNKHHKKWLVRAVRCAIDEGYYNKQAFVLVHEKQDSGKSTWCRYHCPETLKDYMTEELLTGQDKDTLIHLAKNFIINLDELDKLEKREVTTVKSLFSKERINLRLPYESNNSRISRKCSFIGSTNRDTFLQDETGSVRWLCFKIKRINFDYKKEVNIDNVWRQALHLYQSNEFEYNLTQEEKQRNEERNQEFQSQSIEVELIAKYFEPAQSFEEDSEFMTSTEVLLCLQGKPNVRNLNTVNIGKAMKQLGFERKKQYKNKNQVWGYFVKRFQ